MADNYNLSRFVAAQEYSYDSALMELNNGRKMSHWMWYIFPQLRGLGHSYNSNYYGMSGIDEAKAYLNHPILGVRLKKVCAVILELETSDAKSVFGGIDSHKLRSSMTLFDVAAKDDIFDKVLMKFYGGKRDQPTVAMLQ